MAPPSTTSDALDPRSLEALRETLGNEDSFQGILRDFLASSLVLSHEFEAGLSGGKAKDLGLAAHTLKSMAWLLGAKSLGETCRQVESLTHEGRPTEVPPQLLRRTLTQLAATRQAIGSLVA